MVKLGVRRAVLSPGSRNAPLILAFSRHPEITCYSVPDERSAAFIALGMARTLREPVVIACTSGSAALNYAPAVAEAFFQQVPLIVLTADRPPEWIGQQDGQTIHQPFVYGTHVKKSYTLQADLSHGDAIWHVHRTAADACHLALEYPQGPVHINTPFREPFYPEKDDEFYYDSDLPVAIATRQAATTDGEDWDNLLGSLAEFPRKLIVGGQSAADPQLSEALSTISSARKIPVIGDIISNLHPLPDVIRRADLYAVDEKTDVYDYFTPDLLITFGQSTISKNIKLLLRRKRPRAHWHIQPAGEVANTFQSVTRIIRCSPKEFFRKLNSEPIQDGFDAQKQENYRQLFTIEERKTDRFLQGFFETQPLGEFEMVYELFQQLPSHGQLHLANSMAVRYANWAGIPEGRPELEVFANRGTSGIDGCSSTAAGSALASDKLTILVTGDVGFFYDRNAFWHNYPLDNLRILLLNNHGGGIFRMISGPGQLPELQEYFETRQPLTGRLTAEEFGMEYLHCDKKSKIKNFIRDFLEPDPRPKLLEVESDSEVNQQILREFKRSINAL